MHTHRRIPTRMTVRSYQAPVAAPEEQNPSAHGNLCMRDMCACGAVRDTNVNGRHQERGPWQQPPMLKPGREVLDPHNRVVTVVAVEGDAVTVRLAGPYGATMRLSRSMLRAVEA